MLSKVVSSTIFKVFGMNRPGIEPRSPGPLANTLTAGPSNIKIKMDIEYMRFFFFFHFYWLIYLCFMKVNICIGIWILLNAKSLILLSTELDSPQLILCCPKILWIIKTSVWSLLIVTDRHLAPAQTGRIFFKERLILCIFKSRFTVWLNFY